MKPSRIKRSFTDFPDPKFIEFFKGVISDCKDNPGLPNIAAPLATFEASFDKFVASMPSRSMRNMVNTAIKNENRKEANFEDCILASFVEFDSRLNEVVMKSTNFETTEKPQAKGKVGLVKGIKLATNGINQMMIVSCDSDPNATLYSARVSTDKENWKWFGAAQSKSVKVTELPNGVKLYVQMRLENAHGNSPWSKPVTGIIGVPEIVQSIHN
jgi:hypothetical protein